MNCRKCLLPFLAAVALQPAIAPARAAPAGSTAGGPDAVRVSTGTVTIPTYCQDRKTQPPLFSSSTLTGLYPFTSYTLPFREGGPAPQDYEAIFVENEYLKLTYVPEFGGRFLALYDKLRHRQMFYVNDVIKPTQFNPRSDWPVGGIELTGPRDVHELTLHGEPFWSHTIVRHANGGVSLVLGELDPVYHVTVDLSATLAPGVAAMKIDVFCDNGNDGRVPQMFWTNAGIGATEKTRFIYPMTRTVGHVTGEVADWPIYEGVDYSWYRNNQHMLGVFGIDLYDNFGGAYQFDRDYGVFRFADRRVVQGLKMWTFGNGLDAARAQAAYTDRAGPYYEVQSGRMVWDGHYEWLGPHETDSWTEWWMPVAGIGGLTTLAPSVALNLDVKPDGAGRNASVDIALSPVRLERGARLLVTATVGGLLDVPVDLIPGIPIRKSIGGIPADGGGLRELEIRLVDRTGQVLLDYRRPDADPGRKEYSPFAQGLENPPKKTEEMSAEELVLAAEFKLKELNVPAALHFAGLALQRDAGYSRAHALLGVLYFAENKFNEASSELRQAVERDPYGDGAWYYLAMSLLKLGDKEQAERDLYYIWPDSAYYGAREYQLGRLAFNREDYTGAAEHLRGAVNANGRDLDARLLLAMAERKQGDQSSAREQLAAVIGLDPANRVARSEQFFLSGDESARAELLRLMGEQTQEALDVSIAYSSTRQWRQAADLLRMVERNNRDPWGTSPVFYYTVAYDLEQMGGSASAVEYRRKARLAANVVDRFPYRPESLAPLESAVQRDPADAEAKFNLACLLYCLGRPEKAISQWEAEVRIDPAAFKARRALGLAYGEQGKTDQAVAQLEKAVDLNPGDIDTVDDLGAIYARAGRPEEQLALLSTAWRRNPSDDDLALGVLNADLMQGRFDHAATIIGTHKFALRHRSYTLRDAYRQLQYGLGAEAFNRGEYGKALRLFQSALQPPASLGVDDFQGQSSPRLLYAVARALDGLGRKDAARLEYEESLGGIDLLVDDPDSWIGENFAMVLSLERLGRKKEAADLAGRFEAYARSQSDAKRIQWRAESLYVLALVNKHAGREAEARRLLAESLKIKPDFLWPRFELRGDVLDPLRNPATN